MYMFRIFAGKYGQLFMLSTLNSLHDGVLPAAKELTHLGRVVITDTKQLLDDNSISIF